MNCHASRFYRALLWRLAHTPLEFGGGARWRRMCGRGKEKEEKGKGLGSAASLLACPSVTRFGRVSPHETFVPERVTSSAHRIFPAVQSGQMRGYFGRAPGTDPRLTDTKMDTKRVKFDSKL